MTTSSEEARPSTVLVAVERLHRWVVSAPLTASLAVLAALLFVGAYWTTLLSLMQRWNTDENYTHGYLVPLASLYLLHHSLEQRPGFPSIKGGTIAGSLLLIVGLLLLWGAAVVPSLLVECASMLLVLAGAALLAGGWRWWTHLWAPVLFLVFMVPWPSSLYSQVAFPLQLLSSQIAAFLLSLVGVPVLSDGSLIHLPGQTMHVAQACSGLRQLTAFLAMAAALALLLPRPGWYRTTLLLSAVPVALSVNILRVTLTAGMYYIGLGEWTEGAMHTLEGLGMILAGFALLLALTRLLDWLLVTPAPMAPPRLAMSGGATR